MTAAARADTESPDIAAVLAYIDAWNAHDAKAIRNCFTADGELLDPFKPVPLKGEQIFAFASETLAQFPTVRFELREVYAPKPGVVCFELTCTASVQGKPVTLKACDVGEVRNGKFAQIRSYFDRAGIAEQLAA
jgi:ketosteroid isomerase-like protein